MSTAALAQDQPAAELVEPRPDIWERPELLRIEGGPRDWRDCHGIGAKLWFTQFYQGVVAGDGDDTWQYGDAGICS
jgi:hypothetical protein